MKHMPQSTSDFFRAFYYMKGAEFPGNQNLTPAECDVYGAEYSASGWTGALHNYRHRRTAFPANIAEQLTSSGKTIDVPARFIAGKQDWGADRIAGGVEGPAPQEEQPETVSQRLIRFLKST